MKYFSNIAKSLLLGILPFGLPAQVGNPAPNFTVTDIEGNTHTLYDYLNAGKVVVLDFYYTTCGPCQFYSPQVNLAYTKYGCNNANVIFMSIDYDDTNAEVSAYDQQYNIHFPSVSGTNGGGNAVVNSYGVVSFPTLYVIDSSRMVIEQIDPPTLVVFDYRFQQHGILPADCNASATQESNSAGRLELFPNPVGSDGNLYLHLPGTPAGAVNFEIINVTGQSVQQGQTDLPAPVNTDNLPKGLYFLKAVTADDQKIYSGTFVR